MKDMLKIAGGIILASVAIGSVQRAAMVAAGERDRALLLTYLDGTAKVYEEQIEKYEEAAERQKTKRRFWARG